jgi:hypothetical protein
MKKRSLLSLFLFCCLYSITNAQTVTEPWWKHNNLRVIQANLPAYEAATLNPDSLVKDLIDYSANTLIINAGGIMAFYKTKLDFHYINPYMKDDMLAQVVKKCHENHIKVIVRFDFSRVHESIFKAHPDWCYISPKNERIINTDMYVVSINAPYVQDKAFRIIEEVIDTFPVDGIFLNMPGYQVNNPYEGKYHGIDQNESDKKAFAAYSNSLTLPTVEDKADPVYQKYLAFKKSTIEDWSERLEKLVKSKSNQIAICTYLDKHVDIIRHESQTNSLPYWPYSASDNVNNARNSYPDHIISNASIQQISFQSRYNAVEPEEVCIRLYENIANGSGLDISLMGDMRGYEDERNFDVIKKIYAHHKKHELYFGNYTSVAKIALIAPGAWPNGEPMQEYRGIQLMLKEAHLPFDIIEDAQIANLKEKLQKYKLVILPEITYLKPDAIAVLKDLNLQGTNLIATNRSFFDSPETLKELFGAKIINKDHEGSGFYLSPDNKELFKRFRQQKMLFWKFNLGLYDLSGADKTYLPILSKGRPGPPEIIGGYDPTNYYAMGVKENVTSKNVILPINMGKLYYLHGYEQHKNILLDIIDYVFPENGQIVQTDAPERVEVILQEYRKNIESSKAQKQSDGLILHLVNLTGFSGNTYFKALPVYNTTFKIKTDFKPSRVFSLNTNATIPFNWKEGFISFKINKIEDFEGIVVNR